MLQSVSFCMISWTPNVMVCFIHVQVLTQKLGSVIVTHTFPNYVDLQCFGLDYRSHPSHHPMCACVCVCVCDFVVFVVFPSFNFNFKETLYSLRFLGRG